MDEGWRGSGGPAAALEGGRRALCVQTWIPQRRQEELAKGWTRLGVEGQGQGNETGWEWRVRGRGGGSPQWRYGCHWPVSQNVQGTELQVGASGWAKGLEVGGAALQHPSGGSTPT